jgi:AP-3 complex subunit mu
MPKTVLNMSLTPSQGKYTFDSVKKSLSWDVGKIDPTKIPYIKGNMTLQNGSSLPESSPPLHVIHKFFIISLLIDFKAFLNK